MFNHTKSFAPAILIILSCVLLLAPCHAAEDVHTQDIHNLAENYVGHLNTTLAGPKPDELFWLERATLVSPFSEKNNPFLNKNKPSELPSYLKPSIILTYVIHDPDTITAFKENLPAGETTKKAYKAKALEKYCRNDKTNEAYLLLKNGYSISEQYETEKAWYLFGYKITIAKCNKL